MSPTISVVVATYNRCRLLDECLSHLGRQTFAPGDEVIVVDNGSTDDTWSTIDRHASAFPVPIRRLSDRRPGKSYGLQSGIAAATGNVIAFTDDDVNVDSDWLDEIRKAMTDETLTLVCGPIAPRWEQRPPRWLREQALGRFAAPLALVDYGSEEQPLGVRTALGANMAVRREALVEVGGFSTDLGRIRGTLLSGEDHDLCCRIQAAAHRAVYCPSIRVRHWVPASRTRAGYFVRWYFWLGITHARLERGGFHDRAPGWIALWSAPLNLVRQLLVGASLAAANALIARRREAMSHAIDAAFAAGYIAATVQTPRALRRQLHTKGASRGALAAKSAHAEEGGRPTPPMEASNRTLNLGGSARSS